MKITKKPWGLFREFLKNKKCTVKIIEVNPKGILSLQSHSKRTEFWYVLEGNPVFVIGKRKKKCRKGDSVNFGKNVKHRIVNKANKKARILEISSGYFDEKDIKRYEDVYGRK